MKKLVYICYHFPKISETFILNEIRYLHREFEIEVCALDRPAENLSYHKEQVRSVHYFNRAFRDFGQLRGWALAVLGFGWRHPVRCLESLNLLPDIRQYPLFMAAYFFARKYRHAGPVLLHATFSAEAATMTAIMAKILQVPYSVTDQAQDYIGKKTGIFHHLQNASLVIASCRYTRRKLLEINRAVPAHKIKVIYSGIDLEHFPNRQKIPPLSPFSLLTVTRLIDTKGIEYVLRAMPRMIQAIPDLRYQIIGDGPLRPYLEKRAREMGIGRYIQFLGSIPNPQLPENYQQAHIFLLPCVITSRQIEDSLPLVIGEAMATGLPVITTGVGGISELVKHQYNGFIVPQRNSLSIAETVIRIHAHYQELSPVFENARQSVYRNYNVAVEKARLLDIFRRQDYSVT